MSEERKIHVFAFAMEDADAALAGKVADVLHSLSTAFLRPRADPVAFRDQFRGVESNDVVVLWHKERLLLANGTISSMALTGRDSRYLLWLAEAHARFGTLAFRNYRPIFRFYLSWIISWGFVFC